MRALVLELGPEYYYQYTPPQLSIPASTKPAWRVTAAVDVNHNSDCRSSAGSARLAWGSSGSGVEQRR